MPSDIIVIFIITGFSIIVLLAGLNYVMGMSDQTKKTVSEIKEIEADIGRIRKDMEESNKIIKQSLHKISHKHHK